MISMLRMIYDKKKNNRMIKSAIQYKTIVPLKTRKKPNGIHITSIFGYSLVISCNDN